MPAFNEYNVYNVSRTSPPTRWESITAHDVNELTYVSKSIYIETGGDIAVVTEQGNDITIAVPDNFYLIGHFKQVKATGTTATGLWNLSG